MEKLGLGDVNLIEGEIPCLLEPVRAESGQMHAHREAVSYTHLKQPKKREVKNSVVAVS